MILNLNKVEIALLVVNMAAMRKNVRRGFKSNYGKEGKEMLSSYDEAKTTLEAALQEMEEAEPETEKELHYNIKEMNMLNSFVPWYVQELELEFESAGKKIKGEDQQVLEALKQVKEKIEEVISNHA